MRRCYPPWLKMLAVQVWGHLQDYFKYFCVWLMCVVCVTGACMCVCGCECRGQGAAHPKSSSVALCLTTGLSCDQPGACLYAKQAGQGALRIQLHFPLLELQACAGNFRLCGLYRFYPTLTHQPMPLSPSQPFVFNVLSRCGRTIFISNDTGNCF